MSLYIGTKQGTKCGVLNENLIIVFVILLLSYPIDGLVKLLKRKNREGLRANFAQFPKGQLFIVIAVESSPIPNDLNCFLAIASGLLLRREPFTMTNPSYPKQGCPPGGPSCSLKWHALRLRFNERYTLVYRKSHKMRCAPTPINLI